METSILPPAPATSRSTRHEPSTTLLAAVIAVASLGFASASAQDGKTLYEESCAVCHSIGDGPMAGPDLQNIGARREERWLIAFVQSPQSLIDSGDVEAKKLFDEYEFAMPDQELSEAEVKLVLGYIQSQSAAAQGESGGPAEGDARSLASATGEEIAAGRHLFAGTERFASGAAPCVGCHTIADPALTVGGGTLARDLTGAYARMKDGVVAITASPPFPAMAAAYRNHPLTDDEVFRVAAFLKKVGESESAESGSGGAPYLVICGVVGFAVVLVLLNLVWSQRIKSSTKHAIYERQIRTA